MDISLRERILGIALAFAGAFLYASMYFSIQYGEINPFDFHIFRSLILVMVFLLPKLCQKKTDLLSKDAKIRVSEESLAKIYHEEE